MFKIGDKVRLVKGDVIDYESTVWWELGGLKIGGEYTVDYVLDSGDIRFEGYKYNHHPDHFELIDKHEYIIKLNQSEIDALVDMSGSIYGNGNTMRKHIDLIWDILYKDLELYPTDPYLTKTQCSFRFLK
jgi:hypothetical protein